MNYQDSIEKTKQGFEASFRVGTYYNKQTRDARHLELILGCIPVESGMKILDLGTGSGYLAFVFAKQYPQVQVVGLDIVVSENQKRAEAEGLTNLKFVAYEGMEFPFEDGSFDAVITRYALHHFPAIRDTFQEISRVLKAEGSFFLADPAPNEDDVERFVDEYMQMKKDGHIKFYTKTEWKELGAFADLKYVSDFEASIRFSRKRAESLEFEDIVSRHKKEVIEGYEVEVTDEEIWITETVRYSG